MFQSNFFEAFSRFTSWPLIIFVPVVGYFVYETFFDYHLHILPAILLLLAGIAVWSLTEYLMHRFLFHYTPTSDFGKRLHFVFHGVHHDYPNDAQTPGDGPCCSIPLAFLYYYAFRLLMGPFYVAPFFSGFVLGYLFYDMTHYAIHHFYFKNGLWMKIKKHHTVHHFRDHDHGYGVSSKFWDIVFRTDFKDQDPKDAK